MKHSILALALTSFIGIAAGGCTAQTGAEEPTSAESNLDANARRLSFAGLTIGMRDDANALIGKLQARGLAPKLTDGYFGPSSDLEVSFNGETLHTSIINKKVDHDVRITAENYGSALDSSSISVWDQDERVVVSSEIQDAIAQKGLRIGTKLVRLDDDIHAAANDLASKVVERRDYSGVGTEFVFDATDDKGDLYSVVADHSGKVVLIAINSPEFRVAQSSNVGFGPMPMTWFSVEHLHRTGKDGVALHRTTSEGARVKSELYAATEREIRTRTTF